MSDNRHNIKTNTQTRNKDMTYYAAKFLRESKDKPGDWIIINERGVHKLISVKPLKGLSSPVASLNSISL